MNILIAGIPSADLLSHVSDRYGEDVKLFVSESRPFEGHVAREIAAATEAGYSITLCTDNMIGSLMKECDIGAVWSLYSKAESGLFTAINGARMSAILAKGHGVPFILYHRESFPHVENGYFAGTDVTVEGAGYIEQTLDTVGADLVAEVV